jgi:hypothetical protein
MVYNRNNIMTPSLNYVDYADYEFISIIDSNDKTINDNIHAYCKNPDVHSTMFVTFWDVFSKIYFNRIKGHVHEQEMLCRLKQEMNESKSVCFTGKLGRVVNVLVGFYDDIELHFADSDQINAKINIAKETILEKYSDLSIDEQKNHFNDLVHSLLSEISVDEKIINEWLDHCEFNS